MTFSRAEAGGEALLALDLDSACSEGALQAIRALPVVGRAVPVELGP